MHSRRVLITCAWAAAVMVAAGFVGVARTRADLSRSVSLADGTPVEMVCPAWITAPVPAAVVVHGFSGSRQVMYGIGQTLARNGMCAALIDLPGHGANRSRMGAATAPGQAAGFDAAVASAVRFLRAQPGVSPNRIALIGHSMGAGVVMRFAAQHPEVAATVAISGAGLKASKQADRPRNLLLVVGGWEFGTILQGSRRALHAAYPAGTDGTTYGRPEDGTARRLVIVPRVEHIGILFSRAAIVEIVHWVGMATGLPTDRAPVLAQPMPWVWLIYAGLALGFLPLSAFLFGRVSPDEAPQRRQPAWPWQARVSVLLGTPMAAALAARLSPTRWIPLMTADYLASFFFSAGIVASAVLVARRRRLLTAPLGVDRLWGTVVVTLYALCGFAITAQFTWLGLQLVGERRWIALAALPVWFIYFLADEAMHADLEGPRRAGWYVAGKLVTVGVLLGSVTVLGAPFFLLLLAPALVPLFLLHGFYSQELDRVGAGSWPAAFLHAAVFAWTMAAVFPLV